jgi:TIR domain
MSSSMYEKQVNRLSDEIATLRGKLAEERRRIAGANAKTAKAAQGVEKAVTKSQLASKAREAERHQKAGAGHEKKTAELEKAIARRQRGLTDARTRLARAQQTDRAKEDREAERRRKAELSHIREIERRRRAITVLPEAVEARAPSALSRETPVAPGPFTDTYDVCLSFAGEQRDYVERIAERLKSAGLDVFYDQDEDIAPKLWGNDLGEYLDYIYREGSRFCLMFISTDYAAKPWARHERRSALARVIEEGGDYLLPARFDDTELPGLRPTTAYLDLREVAPNTLVDFVLKKLERS